MNVSPRGVNIFARPVRLARREMSLRASVAAFAFVVCSAIFGVFGIDMLHARSVAENVARRDAENLAQSLAQQAADTFESVDGILSALADGVAAGGSTPTDRSRLQQSMANVVSKMPRVYGLFMVDGRGHLIASNSSAAYRSDLRFDREPSFVFHRTHPGTRARISGPVRSATDDIAVIEMTRRLDGPDGRFAGMVVAEIAVAFFEASYAGVDIGHAGAIALLADDGTLMIRRPSVGIGRKLLDSPIFSDPYKYDSAATLVHESPVDGILRLTAFRRLDLYPAIVSVSFAQSEYLAQWRSDAWTNAIVLVLVIGMIASLACGLGAQVDRRRRAEETLKEMALADGLTGLANRRNFDAAIEREWRTAARDHAPLALLMIDVDNFKRFNDRYGHQLGDDVLKTIAASIAANIVRPRDLAARYGGEEFAVILPLTDNANAFAVGERIRRAIVALSIPHADGVDLGLSVAARHHPRPCSKSCQTGGRL